MMNYFTLDLSGTNASVSRAADILESCRDSLVWCHDYGMAFISDPNAMCEWHVSVQTEMTARELRSFLGDRGLLAYLEELNPDSTTLRKNTYRLEPPSISPPERRRTTARSFGECMTKCPSCSGEAVKAIQYGDIWVEYTINDGKATLEDEGETHAYTALSCEQDHQWVSEALSDLLAGEIE